MLKCYRNAPHTLALCWHCVCSGFCYLWFSSSVCSFPPLKSWWLTCYNMTTPSVICKPNVPHQQLFVFCSCFIYLIFYLHFIYSFPLDASAALHVHLSSETAECLLASPLKPDLVNALEHLLRQRLNATHSNTLSLQHQYSSAARSLAVPHQTPRTQSFLPRSRCPNKQAHRKMTI